MQTKHSSLGSDTRKKSRRHAKEWLVSAYPLLNVTFGDLKWWPGDSPLEIIIGAILTQNTAWRNVERAIQTLKERDMLSFRAILDSEEGLLADSIRSSGCYNLKTKRLKSFLQFIQDNHGGDLDRMFAGDLRNLREQMLEVPGIGEETADSILLYAGQKPIFVVDAYTKRILHRHAVIDKNSSYATIQALFMETFPAEVPLYNQYHALIVATGKMFCRKEPKCTACPLFNLP